MQSLEEYLAPVSPDFPCGSDDYDKFVNVLHDMLLDVAGNPDVGFSSSDNASQGSGNWSGLLGKAEEFFENSKHLELAWFILMARGYIEGLPGISAGVELFERLLSRYPDEVHPVPGDEKDTLRRAIISRIDDPRVVASVGSVPIVNRRFAEKEYTLNQLLRIKGEASWAARYESKGVEKDDARAESARSAAASLDAGIAATFAEDPGFFTRLGEQARTLSDALTRLEAASGSGTKSPFEKIMLMVDLLKGVVTEALGVTGTGDGLADAGSSAVGGEQATPVVGIRGREDVRKNISLVIQYYKKSEPTSPVPHLLSRVLRVVDMNFMQIVAEFKLAGDPAIEAVFGALEVEQDR